MADDIVNAWHCKQIPNGQDPIVVCERETLQAEIERLRAAGDLLAAALRAETVNGQMAVCDGTHEAFAAWQEACRG